MLMTAIVRIRPRASTRPHRMTFRRRTGSSAAGEAVAADRLAARAHDPDEGTAPSAGRRRARGTGAPARGGPRGARDPAAPPGGLAGGGVRGAAHATGAAR